MKRFDPQLGWIDDEETDGLDGLTGIPREPLVMPQLGNVRGRQVQARADPGFVDRANRLQSQQDTLLGGIRQRAGEGRTAEMDAINIANSLATAGGVQKGRLPDATPYIGSLRNEQSILNTSDNLEMSQNESIASKMDKWVQEAFDDEVNMENQDWTRDWQKGQFEYQKGQDARENSRADRQLELAEIQNRRGRFQRVGDFVTAEGRPVFYDTDSKGVPIVVDSAGNQVRDLRRLGTTSGGSGGSGGSGSGGSGGRGSASESRKSMEAVEKFNQDIENATQTLADLRALRSHEGIGPAVGSGFDYENWGGMIADRVSAGSGADNFRNKARIAAGQLKVAASGALKGTLSNSDMQMLSEAVGALEDFNVDEATYIENVKRAEAILARSIQRAQQGIERRGGSTGSSGTDLKSKYGLE